MLFRIAAWACLVAAPAGALGAEPGFQAWTVDPLVKVFRDTPATSAAEAVADVARGEHATFQIVVRSTEAMTKLRCFVLTCSPIPDPAVMRVFQPCKGKETLDEFNSQEASFAGADHRAVA